MKKILVSCLMISSMFIAAQPALAMLGAQTPVMSCVSEAPAHDNAWAVMINQSSQDGSFSAELFHTSIAGRVKVLETAVTYKAYRCAPNARCLNSPTYYNSEDLNLTIFPQTLPGSTDRRGEFVAEVNGARVVEQVRCFVPMHIM